MHRIIKKTIKYTGYIFLLLIIVLIAGISYLYYSADMMQPKHEPMIPMREVPYADTIIVVPAEVLYKDTLDLRFYANNFLRHSESGLWELFVRGDALERGNFCGSSLYYSTAIWVRISLKNIGRRFMESHYRVPMNMILSALLTNAN